MTFVCAYMGVPGDCQECGFHDPTYTGFCSHECREARAGREERHRAADQDRRDADDAFGREADRLKALGHTDLEIDEMLKGMP
jgi:predicted ATP-dependent serine protease